MKDNEDLKSKELKLTDNELSRLRFVIQEIEKIQNNPVVSEDVFKLLTNVTMELFLLRETFMQRIIRLLKQNHSLD